NTHYHPTTAIFFPKVLEVPANTRNTRKLVFGKNAHLCCSSNNLRQKTPNLRPWYLHHPSCMLPVPCWPWMTPLCCACALVRLACVPGQPGCVCCTSLAMPPTRHGG